MITPLTQLEIALAGSLTFDVVLALAEELLPEGPARSYVLVASTFHFETPTDEEKHLAEARRLVDAAERLFERDGFSAAQIAVALACELAPGEGRTEYRLRTALDLLITPPTAPAGQIPEALAVARHLLAELPARATPDLLRGGEA